MNIMSLFNTQARRREKNYQAICKTFEREGVDTKEKAEECRRVMLSNAKTYVSFILLIGLSLAIFFSSSATLILICTGIFLVIVITPTVRGRMLITRYIEEFFDKPEDAD